MTRLMQALPEAVFATNPCRVRYATQQLVLFRDDVEHRMRRQVLMTPPGAALTPVMPSRLHAASHEVCARHFQRHRVRQSIASEFTP